MKTSGGLSPEWTNRKYKPDGMWAYQPVKKPAVPEHGHPVDALLAAKMPAGLTAAPPADRVTLLRRATFDLTGLPPKLHEVEAFVRDARPDAEAFASVVGRLLESPHYGERMAQHWLDVTRYALCYPAEALFFSPPLRTSTAGFACNALNFVSFKPARHSPISTRNSATSFVLWAEMLSAIA